MLRGIAILLVLGRHAVAPPAGLGFAAVIPETWTRIGWSGVDLFFVLSGFLVSGLLFAEYQQFHRVDIRRFVIRRGFKIWPPYLVYVGFVALWLGLKQLNGRGEGVWAQLWPNFFHVQNYFHTPRVHTWSLAVEEHFYLVAALLFLVILAGRHADRWLRALPAFVGVAVLGLALARTAGWVLHGPDHVNLYATHLRFDGLLIGTLVAYWFYFRPAVLSPFARRPGLSIAVGILLAAPVLWLSPEGHITMIGFGLAAMYVGYALVLVGVLNLESQSTVGAKLMAGKVSGWIAAIGFYSYSIYLWHIDLGQTPVHKLAERLAGVLPSGVVYLSCTALFVALSIIVGRAMARLLEQPSLALRERLFPAKSRPLKTISTAQV